LRNLRVGGSTFTSWGWSIFKYAGIGPADRLQLDNNSKMVRIAASNGQLYQLHSAGTIFRCTGTPMTRW